MYVCFDRYFVSECIHMFRFCFLLTWVLSRLPYWVYYVLTARVCHDTKKMNTSEDGKGKTFKSEWSYASSTCLLLCNLEEIVSEIVC